MRFLKLPAMAAPSRSAQQFILIPCMFFCPCIIFVAGARHTCSLAGQNTMFTRLVIAPNRIDVKHSTPDCGCGQQVLPSTATLMFHQIRNTTVPMWCQCPMCLYRCGHGYAHDVKQYRCHTYIHVNFWRGSALVESGIESSQFT